LNIAEATGQADARRTYAIARGSAMECASALDALLVLKAINAATHRRGCELLEPEVGSAAKRHPHGSAPGGSQRIVAMLTKLCR
jgi:hypothetical protein